MSNGARAELKISMQRAMVGDRVHILTVARDIGERRAIEKTMREGEKLRVVGQLARGVAHDFNNQLTGILGSTTLLKPLVGESVSARGHLDVIEQSARRSAELVSQLLAFARAGKQRSDAVDCNRLVDEVEQLLRRSLDKRIDIRVRKAEAGQVTTFGDATLLQNALLNLALNARDAMPAGGELTLSLRPIAVDDDSRGGLPAICRTAATPRSSSPTRARASTRGPPAHLRAVLHDQGTGTGLGLSTVYGTMRSHGGAARVESRPGEGTRFELPASARESGDAHRGAGAVAGDAERRGPRLAGLRVLVGDDEPFVRETTALLLQRLGCIVETAPSGEAALRLYEAAPVRPDLVLLDHDMPGLSGADTAEQLRGRDGEVPESSSCLAMATRCPRAAASFRGLPKPFSEDQLAQAVLAALKAARRRTVH